MDQLFTSGLQLVTEKMKTNMMETLEETSLSKAISDFCYPISPLIKLPSAYKRIESVIDTYLENTDHTWATQSLATLDDEIRLVKHFYNNDPDHPQLKKEIADLTERYTPIIKHQVVKDRKSTRLNSSHVA